MGCAVGTVLVVLGVLGSDIVDWVGEGMQSGDGNGIGPVIVGT